MKTQYKQNKDKLIIFYLSTLLTGLFALVYYKQTLSGLYKIISQSSHIYTSYFDYKFGNIGGAFINAFIIQIIMCILFTLKNKKIDGTSFLAFFLTFGFSFWGINVLNFMICISGVILLQLIRKNNILDHVEQMLFSTGLAPLYSELLFQYSIVHLDNFLLRIIICILISLLVALILNTLIQTSPHIHEDYCLFNAAWPIGLSGMFLYTFLFRFLMDLSPTISSNGLKDHHVYICFTYCLLLFISFIIISIKNKGHLNYLTLLKESGYKVDYILKYDLYTSLLNASITGILILITYYLMGATFNGVTFGCLFCVVSTSFKGTHIRNLFPIICGYVLFVIMQNSLFASLLLTPSLTLNSQSIIVGLCFASGLSPIAGRFGFIIALLTSLLHLSIVLYLPIMHGAFCLYNGGFSGVLVCAILVPILNKYGHLIKKD